MANLNLISVAIFVLLSLSNVRAEDFKQGIPILRKQSRATITCKTSNFFECAPECDSYMICAGQGSNPLLIQKCQASTPYCESSGTSAACQSTPGKNCEVSSSYQCTGVGYYPGKCIDFYAFLRHMG